MTPQELSTFLKRLGVYHDLYCMEGARFSDKPANEELSLKQGIITEIEELSLFEQRIITKNEGLSLGGPH